MINMNYCRFTNTAKAMEECLTAIENNEHRELSGEEQDGLLDILAIAEVLLTHQSKINELIDNENTL